MIPIALSGDRSYNKDNIRRYLREGGRVIPGASTIHFDEISRKKIYESIDGLRTTKKMLSAKYFEVKDRAWKNSKYSRFLYAGGSRSVTFDSIRRKLLSFFEND